MSYGLTLPSRWHSNEYQQHYLPSPYRAVPIQPNTKDPNTLGPWLVITNHTHPTRPSNEVVCKHETERGARMCARGERCVKGRQHLTGRHDA
jgi:hypothetical protein